MAEQDPRDLTLQALRDELLQLEQGAQAERILPELPEVGAPAAEKDAAQVQAGSDSRTLVSRASHNQTRRGYFAAIGAVIIVVILLTVAILSYRGLICVRVALTCNATAQPLKETETTSPAVVGLLSPTPVAAFTVGASATVTLRANPEPTPTLQLTTETGALQKVTPGARTVTAAAPTYTATAIPTPTRVILTPTPAPTPTASPTPQQYQAASLFDYTAVYERPIGSDPAMVSSLRKGVVVYLCEGTTNTERVRFLASLKPCYLQEPLGYVNASTLSQPAPEWPSNRMTPYPTAIP